MNHHDLRLQIACYRTGSGPVDTLVSGPLRIRHSVHQTDLGGDNPPAVGEAYPGLLLAAQAALPCAGELGTAHRHIRAKGR